MNDDQETRRTNNDIQRMLIRCTEGPWIFHEGAAGLITDAEALIVAPGGGMGVLGEGSIKLLSAVCRCRNQISADDSLSDIYHACKETLEEFSKIKFAIEFEPREDMEMDELEAVVRDNPEEYWRVIETASGRVELDGMSQADAIVTVVMLTLAGK